LTIPALIADIDCRLTELANKEYNNIVFILNKRIPLDIVSDLLHYKRILQYKYCNSEYLDCYTIEDLASKIKILIHKN
jgi:hypothetical protein